MEKGHADVYVDDKGTTPSDELLESGFDADGEVDPGEGKIDKDKSGDPDGAGSV